MSWEWEGGGLRSGRKRVVRVVRVVRSVDFGGWGDRGVCFGCV